MVRKAPPPALHWHLGRRLEVVAVCYLILSMTEISAENEVAKTLFCDSTPRIGD